eukprot:6161295-Ditylum_brightwellii.AAC.1
MQIQRNYFVKGAHCAPAMHLSLSVQKNSQQSIYLMMSDQSIPVKRLSTQRIVCPVLIITRTPPVLLHQLLQ